MFELEEVGFIGELGEGDTVDAQVLVGAGADFEGGEHRKGGQEFDELDEPVGARRAVRRMVAQEPQLLALIDGLENEGKDLAFTHLNQRVQDLFLLTVHVQLAQNRLRQRMLGPHRLERPLDPNRLLVRERLPQVLPPNEAISVRVVHHHKAQALDQIEVPVNRPLAHFTFLLSGQVNGLLAIPTTMPHCLKSSH